MADHTLAAETFQVTFDASIPPALEIDPGDTVTFQTGDVAYARLADGESVDAIGLPNFNRVTGPVGVRGATPGDALRIEVLDVRCAGPGRCGCRGSAISATAPTCSESCRRPLAEGHAQIGSHRVPLRPMIGCIGTAPAEGAGSTFMPAYPFGGNMDLREMEPGTTLYLPVNVAGGLLSMGDLHAAMGSAEPTSVSLEAAGQATLRIGLEPAMTLRFPRLRRGARRSSWASPRALRRPTRWRWTRPTTTWSTTAGSIRSRPMRYSALACDMRLGGPAAAIVMAVLPDD